MIRLTRCYFSALLLSPLLALLTSSVALAENDNPVGDAVAGDGIDFSSADFWETIDGKPVGESWEFSDGEVRLVNPRGGNGSLISRPLPPNFELSWEWNIQEKTNTGLKYRVRKFGKALFSNSFLGIEYQIIDDAPTKLDKGSTASIYDLVAPAGEKTLHPIGQWNQARVVARGNRLEHYLNGHLVASATTTGPSWDKTIALSKFYGAKDFGSPKAGDRIMLTDHGGKASYRKFQFAALEVDAADIEPPAASGPFLGNAMRNSWADQDSIVIWTRTTARPDFVADGLEFVSISTKAASKLSKETDPEKLLGAQLPEDVTLSQMLGACPGAPGRVRLMYFPGKQRYATKTTDWITTGPDSDFTAQWKLEELKPDTQYAAIIEAQSLDRDETTAVVRGAFRTAPKVNAKKDVKFCITTCHDFIRRDDGMKGHKIYPVMTEMQPDFIVHAGDIEYYDKPDPWAMTIELMRFKWGRIFALPSNRDFYSRTTSYFLKDDHDTLKNDCWAGQSYGSVSFEQGVRLFNEEQFPSLKPRYTNVRWGRDLEVWFLEGRDYRSPNSMPDGPEKTILGEEQKAWLFKTLEESTAKFKVICSPTPVVGPDRANKKDNHANEIFAHEGDQIRAKLATIDNVIVLCGDRHWQYASFDSDADLWEFGCGPGSEKHQLGWKPGDERPQHRFLRVAGGFLSGELNYTGEEKQPRLTLRHHKVDGETVSEFHFPIEGDGGEWHGDKPIR
ncbi:PhoD-like phosphatase [Stieleria maiorica]|uniref:PhoD-like phosphatase n=1 Tax=Stieleria maiorica TaxID=2795974 RepID=A0A5B9MK14_9BACT|nr:family 16 glycoside hydrolase [Stieleria maiorica]QEF99965.1 PhoD-like phosphatase [Stieleria maiorica]